MVIHANILLFFFLSPFLLWIFGIELLVTEVHGVLCANILFLMAVVKAHQSYS